MNTGLREFRIPSNATHADLRRWERARAPGPYIRPPRRWVLLRVRRLFLLAGVTLVALALLLILHA